MGSQQKNNSCGDVHRSAPLWSHLMVILLVSALVLPVMSLDGLLCYFCPLQDKKNSCPNITSQCLPSQRCSRSSGHYGAFHMLTAQGCVDADLCGSYQLLFHRGVEFNVSHTCCCKDKCNTVPKPESYLKKLLGMTEAKLDNATTNVQVEEPWDSCVNYTLSPTVLSAFL
ncbi:protein Bouncer-like [Menidia menidia]